LVPDTAITSLPGALVIEIIVFVVDGTLPSTHW